jgi:hypothetical protein
MSAPVVLRGARDKLSVDSILSQNTLFIASETVHTYNSYTLVSLYLQGVEHNPSTVELVPVLPGMSGEDALERVVKLALEYAGLHVSGPLVVRYTVSPHLWCFSAIIERVARDLDMHDRVSWKAVESHDNEAYPALYRVLTEQF